MSRRLAIVITVGVGLAAASLVLAAAASSCVCVERPLGERLDDADAALVGRVVAEETTTVDGVEQRLLTVEVDQRVKGDVEKTLVLRSPSQTSCDLQVPKDRAIGLVVSREPGGMLVADACSVVEPGPLVVAGGEPRGGTIKVAIGLVILALVLLYAVVRLRRGTRPELPAPPSQ